MTRVRVEGFTLSLDGYGAGLDLRALGYQCVQSVASEKATHLVLRRQGT